MCGAHHTSAGGTNARELGWNLPKERSELPLCQTVEVGNFARFLREIAGQVGGVEKTWAKDAPRAIFKGGVEQRCRGDLRPGAGPAGRRMLPAAIVYRLLGKKSQWNKGEFVNFRLAFSSAARIFPKNPRTCSTISGFGTRTSGDSKGWKVSNQGV
jgi:hypothetical protein